MTNYLISRRGLLAGTAAAGALTLTGLPARAEVAGAGQRQHQRRLVRECVDQQRLPRWPPFVDGHLRDVRVPCDRVDAGGSETLVVAIRVQALSRIVFVVSTERGRPRQAVAVSPTGSFLLFAMVWLPGTSWPC